MSFCLVGVACGGSRDEAGEPTNSENEPAAAPVDAAPSANDAGDVTRDGGGGNAKDAGAGVSGERDAGSSSGGQDDASKDAEIDDDDGGQGVAPDAQTTGPTASKPSPECSAYCGDIARACTAENQQYPDEATCLASCAGFATNGAPGTMRGNTLQCRAAHIGNVLVRGDLPFIHCPHAGPTGGGACS
jgi:hypothetical protein